jgi:hypothetical protein
MRNLHGTSTCQGATEASLCVARSWPERESAAYLPISALMCWIAFPQPMLTSILCALRHLTIRPAAGLGPGAETLGVGFAVFREIGHLRRRDVRQRHKREGRQRGDGEFSDRHGVPLFGGPGSGQRQLSRGWPGKPVNSFRLEVAPKYSRARLGPNPYRSPSSWLTCSKNAPILGGKLTAADSAEPTLETIGANSGSNGEGAAATFSPDVNSEPAAMYPRIRAQPAVPLSAVPQDAPRCPSPGAG